MTRDSSLSEVHAVRFFPSEWKRVKRFVRHNRDRWESPSHFVRAALVSYMEFELPRRGVTDKPKRKVS